VSRKTVIEVPDGPPGHSFLSPAIRAGDFVFVSGNAGLRPGSAASGSGASWKPGELVEGGIEAETRQTLENIKRALEAAGATLQDVVKVNTFLRDVDRDFHAYNKVYLEYFPTEPPARTSVGAKIYGNILIEIECVAYAPLDRG
jgi:enamine deaminase RidA (YjgF/YER057c/UK114 family)